MNEVKDIVEYIYKIKWRGNTETIKLELTPDRMSFAPGYLDKENYPEWVKLGFHKCEICTLDEDEYKVCPAALSIVKIIDSFKDMLSYENVTVEIITPERKIVKDVQIQAALSSVLGLSLGLSDCPVLEQFSSMARFHLPFSSIEETMFRTTGSYLLKQYFINKYDGSPDWELEGLKEFYSKVSVVNGNLVERIRSGSIKDASVNAVVKLDNYAKNFKYLFKNTMETLESIFGQKEDQKED
ncbi:MAG: DUF6901 family protein [Elusimicrobiota bacterium]